jgi:sugar-phosphatase
VSHQFSIEAAALLFDNDGVLVSSIASVNRCWKLWAAHYGVPNADQVEIAHGTRAVEIMEKLVPGVDPVEGLKLIEDMEIADVAGFTDQSSCESLGDCVVGDASSARRKTPCGEAARAGVDRQRRPSGEWQAAS